MNGQGSRQGSSHGELGRLHSEVSVQCTYADIVARHKNFAAGPFKASIGVAK